MPYKFIKVDASYPEMGESEVNDFLQNHRIIAVEKHFLPRMEGAMWLFAIEYAKKGVTNKERQGRRQDIDYKEVLSAEEFALYVKLRDLRKKLSEQKGLPLYAIFKNEQLAEIAKRKPLTLSELQEIEGIGEARAKEYADSLFECIRQGSHEKDAGIAF